MQLPNIGQQWPEQGGVNAGLMRGENGKPDYFLIVAADEAGKKQEIEWGGFGFEVPGANHEFDGLENTLALLKAETTHPAAEWAAGLNIEGHNDFYLPARRELSLLYATVPEQFESMWHWSSTQYSARNAWVQYFADGYQGYGHKGISFAVRAVRRYYPLNNSAI